VTKLANKHHRRPTLCRYCNPLLRTNPQFIRRPALVVVAADVRQRYSRNRKIADSLVQVALSLLTCKTVTS